MRWFEVLLRFSNRSFVKRSLAVENLERRCVLSGDPPSVISMSPPDDSGQVLVEFSEPVLSVDSTDFQLWRDGQPLSSPLLSVQADSETNYRVQLPSLSDSAYSLRLVASASDIHDLDDNLLANDAAVQWTVEQSVPSWQVEFAPTQPSPPTVQRVASMGDSMTTEAGGSYVQYVRDEFASSLFVDDVYASAGWKVETIRSVWESQVRDAGYSSVIILAGLPNLTSTTSNAAEIFSNLQSIYDDAGARGIHVIAVSVLPWSQYKKWTPERQDQTLLLNAMIRDYAANHPSYIRYVDAYDQFGMSDDPQRLSPRYDVGDGAHPSAPGDRKLARLIAAALNSFDAPVAVNQSARLRFSEPVSGVDASQFSLSTSEGPVDFQLIVESSETARIDFQVPNSVLNLVQLSVQLSDSGIVDQAGKALENQPATDLLIDYESPTSSLVTDQPHMSETAVGYATIHFSESVLGLSANDFVLTRNRVGIDLTGVSIEPLDDRTFRLNLAPFAQPDGNYRLVFVAHTSVVDTHQNPVLRASSVNWVKLPSAPSVASDTLYLWGTQDDDSLELTVRSTDIQLVIDGEELSFARQGIQRIELAAGNGVDMVSQRVLPDAAPIDILATSTGPRDTVYLFDSLGDDIYQASMTTATLSNSGFSLQAVDFSQIYGISRFGSDDALLIDSPGNDQMEARGPITSLSGSFYSVYAYGFPKLTAQALNGGTNLAELYDSTGDDLFTATPTVATMTVPGYSYSAVDFARVNTRTSSGYDRAVLQGTAGVESFNGQSSGSSWSGSNFSRYVYGYDSVEVRSGGGNDQATIYDSPGNDSLEASWQTATLTMGAVRLTTVDFARTNVYARSGNDSAWFRGHSNTETFIAQPSYSSLAAAGLATYAYGFDNVIADSGGGNDTATLYDSTSDDLLQAGPSETTLTTPGFTVKVRDFKKVTAYARAGNDVAQLVGSAGNETLTGQPTYTSLVGTNFSLYAYAFDRVLAASGGGTDTAKLYDTAGNDSFEASPSTARLYGPGYENIVENFARVNAYARQGNDNAVLTGSPALEKFTAKSTVTSMTGTGFANSVYAFDQVTGRSGGGGDIAMLYDTAGDEQFIGTAMSASIIGAAFQVTAENFVRVNAYASSGTDRAFLSGTSSTETFTGRPEYGLLSGAVFALFASGFDSVTADGAGGADVANLYDSVGDDQATLGALSCSMIGQLYNNSVSRFARVNLFTSSGLNTASVYDSSGNDRFTGLNGKGTLTSLGFTGVLNGFNEITLLPSSAGLDRVTWSNLTYQLNIGLGWIL